MRLRAAAALFVLVAPQALAAPGDEACKRDLFMADAAIPGSYRNMERSKPEERCAAWRRHVEALHKASAIYGRCAVGPVKAAKTSEFNGSAADFERLIGERCKGK